VVASVRTRRIDVGGVTLVVDESGPDATDRRLLAVHGFAGSRDDFSPVLPALAAAGWQVAAADNRGHGDSTHPPAEDDYTVERFADDVIGLADALGWERFVLLGHSFGGVIARHVTVRRPRRVAALVLMNTFLAGPALDPAVFTLAAEIVRHDGVDRYLELLDEQGDPLDNPAHERAVATIEGYGERGAASTRRCSPAMIARVLDHFGTDRDADPDGAAALAGLRCPTLIVTGDEDALTLGPSASLAAAIAGSRLVVLEDAGHNPQFEQTDALLDVLLAFLGGPAVSGCGP
jgi:3-oxoadipate enol-lactonase